MNSRTILYFISIKSSIGFGELMALNRKKQINRIKSQKNCVCFIISGFFILRIFRKLNSKIFEIEREINQCLRDQREE